MAKRSDEIVPVTPEQARKMCEGYTQEDVHKDFLAEGGKGTLGTVEDWLRLKRPANGNALAILHKVINDRLEREGKQRVLPDLLYLLPSPEGIGDSGANDTQTDICVTLPGDLGIRDLQQAV